LDAGSVSVRSPQAPARCRGAALCRPLAVSNLGSGLLGLTPGAALPLAARRSRGVFAQASWRPAISTGAWSAPSTWATLEAHLKPCDAGRRAGAARQRLPAALAHLGQASRRFEPEARLAAADCGRQISATPARVALPLMCWVPSYGEPLELIERCLRGCWPSTIRSFAVWLLMTVGRPASTGAVQALASRLSHPWLHPATPRPATSTMPLPQLQGDLIAGCRCRRVPSAGILRRKRRPVSATRGGFVQTPRPFT